MSFLKKKIKWAIALPIVVCLLAAAYGAVDYASTKVTEVKPTIWSEQDCTSCHKDSRTAQRMKEKRGEPMYCKVLGKVDGKASAPAPTKK